MRRKLSRSAALILSSLLVGLLLAEGALRLYPSESFTRREFPGYAWNRYEPFMGLSLVPGFDDGEVRVNEFGFRGAEIERDKPAGVIRIVCLGDSGTFGITRETVGDDPEGSLLALELSDYPAMLAGMLETRAPGRFEVINAGVMGYSSAHGLRQLVSRVLPLKPDIVTVRFGMNDHAWFRDGAVPREPRAALPRMFLYGFRDWRLLHLALAASDTSNPTPTPGRPTVDLEEFEYNLTRMAEVSRRHGIRLAFVDYPLRDIARGLSTDPAAGPFPVPMVGAWDLEGLHLVHSRYQEVVRAVAARESVPLAEAAPILRGMSPHGFTDVDLVHPSRLGKEAIARLLLERFEEWSWM